MRIASLVPSATEMVCALGLGDNLVGVTHECDYPPEAASLPHLTRTVIPAGLSSGQIDAEVKRVTAEGRALYELDEETLRGLKPELIVTQGVCEVCAVSYEDVRAAAARMPASPEVISLDPESLGEVITDVTRLGEAAGVGGAGVKLRTELERRLDAVRAAVAGAERPRALALEWLDPPFIGGHWIPEMIEIAGGSDALGAPGERSRECRWGELAGAGAEIVFVMPCGWDVRIAAAEVTRHAGEIAALDADRVFALDAVSSFSRPGPRLVDGTELLAHLMHPNRVEAPAGAHYVQVEQAAGPPADEPDQRRCLEDRGQVDPTAARRQVERR